MNDFITKHAVGVADMITLDRLSEESLLENLHLRFSEEVIYVCDKSSFTSPKIAMKNKHNSISSVALIISFNLLFHFLC